MPVLSHPLMRDATIVWPLNEGTGAVAADYSGNRLNGIFNGSPLWVPSKSGHGVGLNADGSYVSVGTDEVFDQMAEFSFACWVYPEDINNRSILYIVGGGDYASLKISRIAGSAGYFLTGGFMLLGHTIKTVSLRYIWTAKQVGPRTIIPTPLINSPAVGHFKWVVAVPPTLTVYSIILLYGTAH
jgi:hypothetical protein